MIRLYRAGSTAFETLDALPDGWSPGEDVVWIDLLAPTAEEDHAVETALGLSIPTREEMNELEASSRLYREGGGLYAVVDLVTRGNEEIPGLEPVTFVLTDGPLVTVRYSEPKSFTLLVEKLERQSGMCRTGSEIFLAMMETIIDRASDILSRTVAHSEAVATHVFAGGHTVGFQKLITKLGRVQIANARIEQSLAGLQRLFAFLGSEERFRHDGARARLQSLTRDAESLLAHNQSVAASINFQLSAALGLINIEQSSIIKIFSVAAVAFLPPTLIASIYGMNFHVMPELSQPWGYPVALGAMVLSAVAPLLWFRRKGWL